MPQHRLPHHQTRPAPSHDQFPVWYFFYGTLADPDVLGRVLQREHIPDSAFKPARVHGGRLTTWAGKYRALVHANREAPPVAGHAFLVQTRDEDALRVYETERYAVVRCRIELARLDEPEQRAVDGLTFLFLG